MQRTPEIRFPFLLAAIGLLAGCASHARRMPAYTVVRAPERPAPEAMWTPPPSPTTPRSEALYDGETGRSMDLSAFVRRAEDADLIAFGELHGNLIGARYQRELLEALGEQDRPIALAMEFFEADQQADLDAYLAGTIDKEAFKKRTKRNKAYDTTHGPLVEWAKEHGASVIAANAPRALVSGYRKYDGLYRAYKKTLSEEEQALLPPMTSTPQDSYWKHFEETMGGGPKAANFFRAQSLWDDAMAENIAEFRSEHPDTRVLFIVGGFHVGRRKGTLTKYRDRRPDDRIVLFTMAMDDDPALGFKREDRRLGDAVLKVGPPQEKAPRGPNPHERPTKSPHELPKSPHEKPDAPKV